MDFLKRKGHTDKIPAKMEEIVLTPKKSKVPPIIEKILKEEKLEGKITEKTVILVKGPQADAIIEDEGVLTISPKEKKRLELLAELAALEGEE